MGLPRRGPFKRRQQGSITLLITLWGDYLIGNVTGSSRFKKRMLVPKCARELLATMGDINISAIAVKFIIS
ncbi:MAG: hypothetical protein C5B49_01275 [Bdellovibrio sp.]|nr:MAG: hypothetical protein C5B49_01275 [Bdellovibrio sp.]